MGRKALTYQGVEEQLEGGLRLSPHLGLETIQHYSSLTHLCLNQRCLATQILLACKPATLHDMLLRVTEYYLIVLVVDPWLDGESWVMPEDDQ